VSPRPFVSVWLAALFACGFDDAPDVVGTSGEIGTTAASAEGTAAEGTAPSDATGSGSSGDGSDPDGGASSSGDESSSGGVDVEDPGTLDSPVRLYTADGTEFLVDEIGEAVAHAVLDTDDNLILYVHGRACGGGGEPQKSLEGAVPELEDDYGARVVMFNWPGSDAGCPLGFPEDEARASGTALAHVLRKLAFADATDPDVLAGRTTTLLTHSMGSLVLEEATADGPLPTAWFDTAMVGSAASARDGHDAWLGLVDVAAQLYVSLNDDDAVLAAAGLGGARLGKNVDGATLAADAIYVDFTAASVNHAYYLHSGQDGAHMTEFYDAIMNGLAYDFAASDAIASTEERDGTFVYHFDGQ
jgi:hypothetical protein